MWTPASESPSWRYNTVASELDREAKGLPVVAPCQDPAALHLKEFLRTVRERRIDTQHMNHVFGPMASALTWFKDQRPNGMKDSIEAMVLAQADMEFMRLHMAPDLDYQSLVMYCLFYFDVRKYLNSQMWIDRNVLAPAASYGDKRRASAYLWKVIAFHGGGIKLLQASVAGKSMDVETLEWMQTFCINTKVKEIAMAVTGLAKMHQNVKIAYTSPVTIKWMENMRGLRELQPNGPVGSGRELLASRELAKSLKNTKKEDILSAEELCDTDKFKDGDFKND